MRIAGPIPRGAIALLILFITFSDSTGQRATEQYIPIGASPGVSGEQSYIGQIVSADTSDSTLVIEAGPDRRHRVRVAETTTIWLDRSSSGLTNIEGSFEDCQVGRFVEAMYVRDDPDTAVWVKVRML